MGTKELDKIINLKPMYDYDLDDAKELNIIKSDIEKIISLFGGGVVIATLKNKRNPEVKNNQIIIPNSGFNSLRNFKVKDAMVEKDILNKNKPRIIVYSDSNKKKGEFIRSHYNVNRILYLPIILKHTTSEHKVGDILFFYDCELFKEEDGELLEIFIDRLLLRIRHFFTQDRMNRKVKQLKTIIDIAKSIETVESKKDLLSTVIKHGLNECKDLFKHKVYASLRMKEGNDLKVVYTTGSHKSTPKSYKTIPTEFQKVIDKKKTKIIEDFQNSSCIKELLKENKENKKYCSLLKKFKSLMLIPIITENTVRGVLSLCSKNSVFRIAEERFFKDMAIITAVALNKLDKYQNIENELNIKANSLSMLKDLLLDILSENDDDRLLLTIREKGLKLVNAYSGNIRLLNLEKQKLIRCHSHEKNIDGGISDVPTGEGICGMVAKDGKSRIIDDIFTDEHWCKFMIDLKGEKEFNRLKEKGQIRRSEISVPLKDRGKTIGAMDAHKLEPNGFTKYDLEIFEDLGVLAGIVISRRNLRNKLDTINNITIQYQSIRPNDIGETLEDILKKSINITESSKGAIAIVKTLQGEKILEYKAVENIVGLEKGGHRDIGDGIMGKAAKRRREVNVHDVPKYIGHIEVDTTIKSEAVLPILFENNLKGILMVASIRKRKFDNDCLMILRAITDQIGIILHSIELMKEKEDYYKIMEHEQAQNLTKLSGMMAHQVNTPLAAIQNNSSIIKEKLSKRKYDLSKYLESIFRSIENADTIIRNLIDFTRKAALKCEADNLHNVLDEAIDIMKEVRINSTINIIRQYDNECALKFSFDRFKLLQVFLNLVDNAYKAMQEKGDRLLVKTERNGDVIGIIIEDNGIGITKKDRMNIFKPLFTTDKIHGTGLGLAICKRFVKLHNGTIRFETKSGTGTKFIILLPVKQEENT